MDTHGHETCRGCQYGHLGNLPDNRRYKHTQDTSSSTQRPLSSHGRTTTKKSRKASQNHLLIISLLWLMSMFGSVGGTVYTVPLYRQDYRRVQRSPATLSRQERSADVRYREAKSDLVRSKNGSVQADTLEGEPGQGYYVQMAIGTPPQMLNILVDTGSSNFAIASAPHPDITNYFNASQSASYWSSGSVFSVPYTQGNWVGLLGQEVVSMASMDNVSIEVSIAFISESENFFINTSNWQGILGLAYAELARPDESVVPFFDVLVEQTDISPVFTIQLCGTMDSGPSTAASMGGAMTLGGIDPSLYKGDIYYVPIYKEWYYEVVITGISVDGDNLNMDCKEYNFDKTIVDSGTTNLRLPKKVFQEVLLKIELHTHLASQVVPQLFWSGDDVLCWDEGATPWSAFPGIDLTLATGPNATITLTLSPQQYLRAVSDIDMLGNTVLPQQDCYKFAISPSETGAVLGAVVMEAFYVVFDRGQKRIGFAVNSCSNRDPNALQPKISGPHKQDNTMDCAYIKPDGHQSALMTVAYVMAGVCGLCLMPLVILFIYWQISRCRHPSQQREPHDTVDGHGLLNSDSMDR